MVVLLLKDGDLALESHNQSFSRVLIAIMRMACYCYCHSSEGPDRNHEPENSLQIACYYNRGLAIVAIVVAIAIVVVIFFVILTSRVSRGSTCFCVLFFSF